MNFDPITTKEANMVSSNKRNKSRNLGSVLRPVVPANQYTRLSDNNRTHEGGVAPLTSSLEELRRSVLGCLLWEDQFYESGLDIADRIASLVPKVEPQDVYELALEARNVMKLRHVPLLLATEMLKYPEHKKLVRRLTAKVIQRPDEIAEILSIYWRNELNVSRDSSGKFSSQRFAPNRKMPMALKRGCRDAFSKFDQYQMLKWQERGNPVTTADAIRLIHPDPTLATRQSPNITTPMSDVYKAIVTKVATAPDTWESRLSAAGREAKKDIFTDMLSKNELGSLALVSNLRGMIEAGVDVDLIKQALSVMSVERVLPYRFITAARYAPSLKPELEAAMFRCVNNIVKLPGTTVLLVDISSSMNNPMSRRRDGRASDLKRIDGAAALCILAQSICEQAKIYLFNDNTYAVTNKSVELMKKTREERSFFPSFAIKNTSFTSPPVGFTLSDAISTSVGGGTDMAQAVTYINQNEEYTRLIVFTDDESSTKPPPPTALGYGINVASGQNGVTYESWIHINGFSEGTLGYVAEYEKQLARIAEGKS